LHFFRTHFPEWNIRPNANAVHVPARRSYCFVLVREYCKLSQPPCRILIFSLPPRTTPRASPADSGAFDPARLLSARRRRQRTPHLRVSIAGTGATHTRVLVYRLGSPSLSFFSLIACPPRPPNYRLDSVRFTCLSNLSRPHFLDISNAVAQRRLPNFLLASARDALLVRALQTSGLI
jgi:hypothetical protein